MKGSRWFIVFIVAFLFIMFAIEYNLPKNFVWKPTFGHNDEQPFRKRISPKIRGTRR